MQMFCHKFTLKEQVDEVDKNRKKKRAKFMKNESLSIDFQLGKRHAVFSCSVFAVVSYSGRKALRSNYLGKFPLFFFLVRAEVEWKKSKLQLRVKRSRKGGTFRNDNASSALPNHNVMCVYEIIV